MWEVEGVAHPAKQKEQNFYYKRVNTAISARGVV